MKKIRFIKESDIDSEIVVGAIEGVTKTSVKFSGLEDLVKFDMQYNKDLRKDFLSFDENANTN